MKKLIDKYFQAIVVAVCLVFGVITILDFYQEAYECQNKGKVMLRTANGYVCVRLEK